MRPEARELSHENAQILVVPRVPDGALDGAVAAVGPGVFSSLAGSAGEAVALLSAGGRLEGLGVAVRLIRADALPDRCVAVGEDTSEVAGASAGAWTLTPTGTSLPLVPAATLCLEATVERPIDDLVKTLDNATQHMSGRLLWKPSGEGTPSQPIELEFGTFRVREVTPAQQGQAIYEITARTRLSLYAPTTKSGVDMVILADCSGSMRTPDMPTPGGTASGRTYVSRLDALKAALLRLIEVRCRTTGRLSRIALMSFTTSTIPCFPCRGGMVEIDYGTPPQTIKEFRDAVNALSAEKEHTDIGQALRAAAQQLCRHGHPNNERVIVLVSDGAENPPPASALEGEAVATGTDALAVMESLHQEKDIQLYAIGIGERQAFDRWWQAQGKPDPPKAFMVPDHALLGKLVEAGGGNPSEVGDTVVLGRYFSGLGAGVIKGLPSARPRAESRPRLHAEELDHIKELLLATDAEAGRRSEAQRVSALAERIRVAHNECNQRSALRVGRPLFFPGIDDPKTLYERTARLVTGRSDMIAYINPLYQIFGEQLDPAVRQEVSDLRSNPARAIGYRVPEVVRFLAHDRFSDLHILRNRFDHTNTPPLEERSAQRAMERDLRRFGDCLERRTGQRAITDDHSPAWTALQLSVLTDLCTTLDEVANALGGSSASPPTLAGARAVLLRGFKKK